MGFILTIFANMQWYFGKLNENNQLVLTGDEAHHCKNVMRIKTGSNIMVTDGQGNLWEGCLEHFTKEMALAHIVTSHTIARREKFLHIAISPTKNIDRFEWFLEKATELGIERITPVLTHRTERSKLNYERLNKVLLSAMKQSQQAWLPQLDKATDMDHFIHTTDSSNLKLMCHAHNSKPITQLLDINRHITILIGPEGDFTEEELGLASKWGFILASLGSTRLRTETAGMAVCAYLGLR